MPDDQEIVIFHLDPAKVAVHYLDGAEVRPSTTFTEHRWNHFSDASEYIQEIIEKEIEKGKKSFIVDLSDASFIVSTDLGAFVSWFQLARNSGGKMVFVCNEKTRGRLQVTGLLHLLGGFGSVAEAQKVLEAS
jgi:anti-anti-sigma factor